MAENDQGQERTEEATPKRRQEARDKGQVNRSRDFGAMLITLGGALVLLATGGVVAERLLELSARLLRLSGDIEKLPTESLTWVLQEALFAIFPTLFVLMLLGVIAGSVPGTISFSLEPLAFKASRLSPLQGFKRMFSGRTLMEALKAILKFVLVAGATVLAVDLALDHLPALASAPVRPAIVDAAELFLYAFVAITLALILIATIDIPFQIAQQTKQLKMTRQEVKEELKNTEGRPEVKGRIRSLQHELAQHRMFNDLPDADVVITNPRHYAVALKYDASAASAPLIVAKGADVIAQRIREVAQANGVEIVRSPMLCRALYFNVELGGMVPQPLFVAVAQVLAYVQQLRLARAGMIPRPNAPADPELPPEYRVNDDE